MSKKTKITKTIKIEKPDKPTITLEVEKILPENISGSEIDRLVDGPDYGDAVSNLREYWISQGDTPCGFRHCSSRLEKDARPNKKYCSPRCAGRERKARFNEENPGRDHKYLKEFWKREKV